MAGQNATNTDLFDAYFRRADLDGDGQISGAEAVGFFQGSNLPKQVLAQVWTHADQRKAGFLNRAEFYNALRLVTVAQSKRELTPDIVKAALYSPASAKIPAPQINLAATPSSQSRPGAPAPQLSANQPPSPQNIGVRGPHGLGNASTVGNAPQLSANQPPSPQNIGFRGPQGLGNASTNQQFFPSQPNQFRPPQSVSSGAGPHPQQMLASRSMLSGSTMQVARPPTSNVSTNYLGGATGGPLGPATSQVPTRGISPSKAQDGFGLTASSLTPSVQPRPPATSGQTPATAPAHQVSNSEALVVSGNGFASGSLFGDVFSATLVQPKQPVVTSSAGSLPVSSTIVPASSAPEPSVKPSSVESLQTSIPQQPLGGQYQQGRSAVKLNNQFPVQSTTASTSTGFPVGAANPASTQPNIPWSKMTQSEVQKYTKVFVQVDTDRDGKITGEQARNLFLSWRLPREVLKQVWDLSDQDNDSMLSLKEFCIALYLMERFREGRPLPTMLPSTIVPEDALFSLPGQPTVPHGSAAWGHVGGLQPPHGARPPAGKPPRPVPAHQPDRTVQPVQQKSKVPPLEKHLVDQLSKEEQESLNAKLKEATEADKKVEELEKEILTSREKIQFYHAKMQELILYKSRCDNRLNEITERVAGDRREVELLAKKYEEKYKQSGDVASKLTLEESTFRDIQEKKMDLYQAIVKMEGDSGDGSLQQRADTIQVGLEELVKNLNERCKQYGLRAKPTSLVELPFGWQPGIQEGTADWDEDWDKFEDEGFTFVKELTLDVQNVIAPPKPKSSLVRKDVTSMNNGLNTSSSDTEAKPEKVMSKGEENTENELAHDQTENGLARSPPDSPAGSAAAESKSQEVQDSQMRNIGADGSPHDKETRSDQDGTESVFSGDKVFDEPSWGTFDTHYDTESVWGFDTESTKDMDHDRRESSLYGLDDFGLKPIKTDSSRSNNMFLGKSSSIFADSVPSTPAYSTYGNSPRRFSSGPDDYSFDKGKSIFADSVPSTPAYSFGNSPRRFSMGSEEPSFDSFSRFDSFNTRDSGFFQSPRHTLDRFDSIRSTKDTEQSHGLSMRFDSFNANDSGFFQSSQSSLARFDSVRSARDSDHGHGFPAFDETDPFGSSGPFKTSSIESQTPKSSSDFIDPFGSTGPFSMSVESQKRSSEYSDPFGSTGPFSTSVESQTPKKTSEWSAF
ncbi:epidermal growth factor receptor substrate 15-like 1 isoform X1 [Pistacia vera]|uniref:epidermal growth factor receptor substrate 15-like 1 isoform X1 n=1 Tax=Pistacia vera TaxID=55513 RepID=UPI0012631498|nr:epidermal growth factor receptor substrate 15-like 1 isoform X1 [Pistacia vera]